MVHDTEIKKINDKQDFLHVHDFGLYISNKWHSRRLGETHLINVVNIREGWRTTTGSEDGWMGA
jgi:hypothetical protein